MRNFCTENCFVLKIVLLKIVLHKAAAHDFTPAHVFFALLSLQCKQLITFSLLKGRTLKNLWLNVYHLNDG